MIRSFACILGLLALAALTWGLLGRALWAFAEGRWVAAFWWAVGVLVVVAAAVALGVYLAALRAGGGS